MTKTTKIMIGLPSNGHWVADSGWALMNLTHYTINYFAKKGRQVEIITDNHKGSLIPQSRNSIARRAIDEGCDYLWFYDVDMLFPLYALCRMVEADKDIIGVNAVTRGGSNFTARVDDKVVATTEMSRGVAEVGHIGTGGILIKTSVFKKMKFPYFFMAMNEFEDSGELKMISDKEYHELKRDTGREIGEDYYFCENAKRLGYKIWIDQESSKYVIHVGDKGYKWQDYYIENCFKDLHPLLFELMGLTEQKTEDIKGKISAYIDKLESYKML